MSAIGLARREPSLRSTSVSVIARGGVARRRRAETVFASGITTASTRAFAVVCGGFQRRAGVPK